MQRIGKEYITGNYYLCLEKVLVFAGFHYKLSLTSTKQCVYFVDYNILHQTNCWEQNDVS